MSNSTTGWCAPYSVAGKTLGGSGVLCISSLFGPPSILVYFRQEEELARTWRDALLQYQFSTALPCRGGVACIALLVYSMLARG